MPAEVALREAEHHALTGAPGSFYSGSGRSNANPKGRTRLSGNRKKGIGAMVIIIGLLMGGGAFLGSSHSLLLPAVEVLSDLNTNTQNTAIMRRLPKVAKAVLSGTNQSGYPSTAQSALTNKLGGNTNINISDFDSNASVRATLTDTINGRAGGYYSDMADNSFYYHGNSRNVFKDYQQTGDSDADVKKFRGTVNQQIAGKTSAQLATTYEEGVEDVDEDGKGTGSYSAEQRRNDVTSGESKNNHDTDAAAYAAAESQITKLSGKVSKAVTWGCTALQIGLLISSTYQIYARKTQMTGALNFLESPSKTMSGQGSQSAANSFLNTITQATPTSVTDMTSASYSVADASAVMDESEDVMPQNIVTINTSGTEDHNVSAVESDGMNAILTQRAPDVKKSYNYSISNASDTITKSLKGLGVTFGVCLGLQAGVAAVSLAVSLIPGLGQISAVGSSTWHAAKNIATSILKNLGIGVVINIAVSSVVAFVIPLLGKFMRSDAFLNFVGYAGGQNLASGIGLISSTLARNATGQSLASKEVALAYNHTTQKVIAQEAEVDRLRRSPFDITSNNTFLGSIVYSLLPSTLSSSPSTGITSVSNLLSTTSTSLAKITGQVSAEGEGTSYNTAFGECENLEDIGATCNAYGGEITVTDPEAIEQIEVGDPTYSAKIADSMDANGEIKDNSGLAKYIKYCAMRSSPFGIYDMNIADDIQNNNVLLNALPYVGDALDILNAGKQLANIGYVDGSACVASSQNPDWEENKYYSLYLADNHILSQWGAYKDAPNPVLAYMQKVQKEQEAEDNSYVARLSRLIGARKEDTELMLDVIAYYQFLDNYDASTRLAMTEENTTTVSSEQIIAEANQNSKPTFEDKARLDILPPKTEHIIYADIRNRSFAAWKS